MKSLSLTWCRKNALAAVLVLIVLFCGLRGGAVAEELSPDGSAAPEPLEDALPWLKINPDTVGWLTVGKIIDTPVVQRDSEFYLEHNFFGKRAYEGTVLLEEDCSILPLDQHLVLYGHNMRNGRVFGELDRFRTLSYLKKNSVVTFNTIYQEGLYVVIGVFDISNEDEDPNYMEMLIFNFEDEEFMDFINEARERSFFEIPIDVQPGDRLLSLVTCSYTMNDGRLIILLREIRPDEDPEEIQAAMQATVEK